MSVACAGDARVKVCPMKMAGNVSFVGCCGTSCMAWREVEPGRGYCGLAGFPLMAVPPYRPLGSFMPAGRGDE